MLLSKHPLFCKMDFLTNDKAGYNLQAASSNPLRHVMILSIDGMGEAFCEATFEREKGASHLLLMADRFAKTSRVETNTPLDTNNKWQV